MFKWPRAFASDERGSVIAETLIAFPILTLVTFGLIEVGNIMWEREQMQAGLRDAARYWSRCRPATANFASTCSEDYARNIAFYGGPSSSDTLRVPGWSDPSQITFTPAKADLPTNPAPDDLVVVSGEVTYSRPGAMTLLFGESFTIAHSVELRHIGW
ncbi:TadE/TadG family type IV pilus assembly protein [Salipiger sp. PrR002]|uniref:TadE/TadG family type IV pilus assembly protein n=1 Tax=Salipiger sp. PrR002 TaxID=2706489 RepID=UPI0013BAF42E|nr:TadE/TadG family type IV pilus assembly protein [Salipiger sp. PrR002]NDW01112.1 pilus assembly protein [Salipiger sp. PrR002]NDW57915.1 pilus assembly protein [Salipiger sp. PrR004]